MKGKLKLIGLAAIAVMAMYALVAPVVSAVFLNFSLPTFIENVGLIAVSTLVLVFCAARAADRVSARRLALKVHHLLRADEDRDHNQGMLIEISRMKNRLAFE